MMEEESSKNTEPKKPTTKTLGLAWKWSPLYSEELEVSTEQSSIKSPAAEYFGAVKMSGGGKRGNKVQPLEHKSLTAPLAEWYRKKMGLQNGYSERSTNPSKTRQRRRREMELEAKVGLASTSEESESASEQTPDEEANQKTEDLANKAKSASPASEPKKPSYRQYLREKRSRSREKLGFRASSAERPFAYQSEPTSQSQSIETERGRNTSQVHWKIHKIPRSGVSAPEDVQTSAGRFQSSQSLLRNTAPSNDDKSDVIHSPVMAPSGPVAAPIRGMSLLSHSVHGALTKSVPLSGDQRKNQSADSYYGPANLGVLSFASSLAAHPQQAKRDAGVPKTATLLQQNLPAAKFESSASPIDLAPVKEKSMLKISENSAFRPIQPATQTPSETVKEVLFPSTTKLGRRLEEELEEPIYVSLKEVTTHPPKGNLSAAVAKKTQESIVQQKSLTVSGGSVQGSPAGSPSTQKHDYGQKSDVFVVKPPTPDESNLERWRARKRSMEQAKREDFLGAKSLTASSILSSKTAPLRKYHTTDSAPDIKPHSPPKFTDRTFEIVPSVPRVTGVGNFEKVSKDLRAVGPAGTVSGSDGLAEALRDEARTEKGMSSIGETKAPDLIPLKLSEADQTDQTHTPPVYSERKIPVSPDSVSPYSPTTMKVKSTVFLPSSGRKGSPSSSPARISPAGYKSPTRSPHVEPLGGSDIEGTKIWFVTPGKLQVSHTAEGAAAVAWKEREKELSLQTSGYEPPNQIRRLSAEKNIGSTDNHGAEHRDDINWSASPAPKPSEIVNKSRLSPLKMGNSSGSFSLDHPDRHKIHNEVGGFGTTGIFGKSEASQLSPFASVDLDQQLRRSSPVKVVSMSDSYSSQTNVSHKAKIFENLAKHKQKEQERTYHHQGLVLSPKKSLVSRAQTVNLVQFQNFAPLATSEEEEPNSPVPNMNQNNLETFARSPGTKKESEAPLKNEEEKDDVRLSVWEKMRLFERKIQEQGQKLYRRGVSRFQTQPVTPEIVVTPADISSSVDEVRAAVVSMNKKRPAPQPPKADQETPSEESGKSATSTLERVKARRVVHLHTDETRKADSIVTSGDTTTEDSFSESSKHTHNGVPGPQEEKTQVRPQLNKPQSGQRESESSSAGEDPRSSGADLIEGDATMIDTEGRLSIGERLAALKSQEEDWRRRISEEKTVLPDSDVVYLRSRSGGKEENKPKRITERMSALLDSQNKWTQRVSEKDTDALTVSGKLVKAGIRIVQSAPAAKLSDDHPTGSGPEEDTPPEKPKRMSKIARQTPQSERGSNRGISMLPQLDAGLDQFYKSTKSPSSSPDSPEVDSGALDAVRSESAQKLALSKGVKPPKRRTKSTPRNPVRQLAESEIVEKGYQEKARKTPPVQLRRQENTERQTNGETPKRPYSAVLDPHVKPGNRGSQLATEALRALAAKEDFGAVKLRRADPSTTPGQATENRPYKELMLIQVKGRKHVQLRLVDPSWRSLNSGDCFLLITSDNVFLYEGRFSNVLECAKAKEVGNYVVETKDMGCLGSSRLIEMNEEKLLAIEEANGRLSPSRDRFFSLLGGGSAKDVRVPQDLDEDVLFEETLAVAYLAYRVFSPNADSVYKLQLSEEYSGGLLQHEMLKEDEVWVLDFGCELYVWNGRSVSTEMRKAGLRLAREILWERPFDTAVVGADPFQPFHPNNLSSAVPGHKSRPDWCLFGQVKDKMETSLFRGKFMDWPEMKNTKSWNVQSGLVTSLDSRSQSPTKKAILELKDPTMVEIGPEELGKMFFAKSRKDADLILEDQSVGRGHELIQTSDATMNKFRAVTEKVRMYHVPGGAETPVEMWAQSLGQFHMEDCYIVRWDYRICSADVRSLTGAESKHSIEQTGRSRVAYFYWHGVDSSRSDQGACALALRDLDPDHNPQVRVTQGLEPPAFLNLFGGLMAIHRGKRGRRRPAKGWRLYALLGGPFQSENCLLEVDSDPDISLRPQGVFLLTSIERNVAYLWIGSRSTVEVRQCGMKLAARFRDQIPTEFGFVKPPSVRECQEGEEPVEWVKCFGTSSGRLKYPRPTEDYDLGSDTFRLFRFTSTSNKQFNGVEAVSSWYSRSAALTFPFEQDDLYGACQPAFFLLDQGRRVWLWEGWLEQEEGGEDQSLAQKLRLARVFAVKTAVSYCRAKGLCKGEEEECGRALVVYGGVEPKEFKALFPVWTDQEEATEANLKAMRAPGAKVLLLELLRELSVSVYPASRLREKPLPEGVDGSKLESYLSDQEFFQLFSMSRQSFYDLPAWKQVRLRKESHLF